MGYVQFSNIINNYLSNFFEPEILEIGIELGTITIPMISNLINSSSDKFHYYGVDIQIRTEVTAAISLIKHSTPKKITDDCINFVQQNSLVFLPLLIENGLKFDLILIDGDHNYYTVSQELDFINNLLHDNSIIIADDYWGPWSEIDYWYGEEETSPQKNNTLATQKVITDKCGVKPAVDDWIANNQHLEMLSLATINNETILLKNNDPRLPENKIHSCHATLIKPKHINL